ncbi:MAG: EAL domain-containing response regulator [Rhodospirillaceae bacterium]|nr:EAL domain-containing response regulator [Rhodospirillaceae bacterium]
MSADNNPEVNRLRVLCVDDEELVLDVIQGILATRGIFEVVRESQARHALERLDNGEQFELLISDLNMPGMDGIEFLRHLAAREFAGGIAIISGVERRTLDVVDSLARAHNLNFLGALQKPITGDSIRKLMDDFQRFASASAIGGAAEVVHVNVAEIRAGMDGGQFDVMFQPKVSVKTRKVVGAEALVRWLHPTHGLLTPESFVPVAEEGGVIHDLTGIVCACVVNAVAPWSDADKDVNISFNAAVDDLDDIMLPEFVVETAAAAGLPPTNLTLEVTESQVMHGLVRILDTLARLRLKGVSLAIDDFGTGFSSLEQLKRCPFTEMKIDKAFVTGAATDGASHAILESSIDLARKLDMHVVAEGVESQEDWDLIADLGCDEAQGYFVAQPMAAEDFPEWRASWEERL